MYTNGLLAERQPSLVLGSKILVLGSPGSGKTTLAKAISKIVKIKQISLDDLYWKDNWKRSSNEEFYEKIHQVLNQSEWILDGNYHDRMLEFRIIHADTIILLNCPTIVAFKSIIQRTLLEVLGKDLSLLPQAVNRNVKRRDIRQVWKLLMKVISYNRRIYPIVMKKIEELCDRNQGIVVVSRSGLNNFLADLARVYEEISPNVE